MRIGILTYHYVFNEGAIWQACCLCSAIRRHFPQHRCEIVDYRHEGKYRALRAHVSAEKETLYESVLQEFLGDRTIVSDDADELFGFLSEHFDLVIVGSDIIWQFDRGHPVWTRLRQSGERNTPLRPDTGTPYRFLRDVKNWALRYVNGLRDPGPFRIPFPNAYWMDPDGPYRKCTFAASVGYSDVQNIPQALMPAMSRRLEALELISVRDKASAEFASRILPERAPEIRVTPDPTWLAEDPAHDVEALFDDLGLLDGAPLAGVLFPPGRYYGNKLNDWVLPVLRERGFKILSVIDGNLQVDVDLASKPLHPFDWWGVISRLDFFFSIRTHPNIAAIKYETPFANVDITGMFERSPRSKSRDMLEGFGLEDCCLHHRRDFNRTRVTSLVEHCLDRVWDWDAIGRQRECNRKVGLDTLHEILGVAQDD